MKDKIAISLNPEILEKIDQIIDGTNIRSRSQAIEVLIKKGLKEINIDTAVLLLSSAHSKIPQMKFKKSTIIEEQIKVLKNAGIRKIIILSQSKIQNELAQVIITKEKENGSALNEIKLFIENDFLVMSGDVYIDFDVSRMISKHKASGKIATIGLMSSPIPGKYGTAILEGDLVTEFREKPKNPESNVINSGIYVFRPDVFTLMRGSIERNVLPELAKKGELVGYFTKGEYVHFGEK